MTYKNEKLSLFSKDWLGFHFSRRRKKLKKLIFVCLFFYRRVSQIAGSTYWVVRLSNFVNVLNISRNLSFFAWRDYFPGDSVKVSTSFVKPCESWQHHLDDHMKLSLDAKYSQQSTHAQCCSKGILWIGCRVVIFALQIFFQSFKV